MKSIANPILLILVMALAMGNASLASIIGFEEIADDTPVRDFYEAREGVSFNLATVISTGLSLNELEFPAHGGTNVAYENTGPVTISFQAPMRYFFAFFYVCDTTRTHCLRFERKAA